ncbi:eukaryotic initiation factor 4A [Haematococcus lacustris]|uniref:Eukaryotic initiation factor 4A n=1 Tax=Haematococcus lacustris TaxID=44745 RepID=A0A699YHY2_HAELA|nr:eukaryotic initiation factor 4A [Haematococcus lacustris]
MRLMNMRPGCSLVLVTSDACLAAVPHKLLPLGASLLIHYDLPHKKEVMTHRLAAAFATQPVPNNARAGGVGGAGQPLPPRAASLSDGAEGGAQIVVSFVVAGRVPEFRAVERFAAPLEIQQMPVHVADIFD